MSREVSLSPVEITFSIENKQNNYTIEPNSTESMAPTDSIASFSTGVFTGSKYADVTHPSKAGINLPKSKRQKRDFSADATKKALVSESTSDF